MTTEIHKQTKIQFLWNNQQGKQTSQNFAKLSTQTGGFGGSATKNKLPYKTDQIYVSMNTESSTN